MTSIYRVSNLVPSLNGIVELPADRGRWMADIGAPIAKQSLPTDPIGTCVRTFDGVPAGSEIRVYDPSANELAGVESCDANHQLSWSVYAAGSPNNTVRIVIVNFAYKIKEFTYTSTVGTSSIPIQAEADKWASNPA